MKNILIISLFVLISLPFAVLANNGDCMMGWGCGIMDGVGVSGIFGMSLAGFVYIAISSFIFAVIFWLVYKWIIKK